VLEETVECPETAEFALILLRKGPDHQRLVDAIIEINKARKANAAALASRATPVTIKSGLTEAEALWAQFELICCDAVSIYVRTEVIEQNDKAYLAGLFKEVSESPEFRPANVTIIQIPATESGEKFLERFVGTSGLIRSFPMTLTVPFKKARIMEDWAARIGAEIKLERVKSGRKL
jgi:hypothetical protein